jgi:mannitol 2-dehydrogenase
MRDIFGDLSNEPSYVEAFTTALTSIWAVGTRETLIRYLEPSSGTLFR